MNQRICETDWELDNWQISKCCCQWGLVTEQHIPSRFDKALLYPMLFIRDLEDNVKWPLVKGTDDLTLVAGWLMRQPHWGWWPLGKRGSLEKHSCSQCSKVPGARRSVGRPLRAGLALCSRAPERGLEVIASEWFSANTSPGMLTNRGKGCLRMSTQAR